MLSPQEQAIDRIFSEGWNGALDTVMQHVRSIGGTVTQDDMNYIMQEEYIEEQ
jgi:hypothetical protein